MLEDMAQVEVQTPNARVNVLLVNIVQLVVLLAHSVQLENLLPLEVNQSMIVQIVL
jgi:hypothetical protein